MRSTRWTAVALGTLLAAAWGCSTSVEPTSSSSSRRPADAGSDEDTTPSVDDGAPKGGGDGSADTPSPLEEPSDPPPDAGVDGDGGADEVEEPPEEPEGCTAGDEQAERDGHCYMRFTTEATWEEAQSQCEALGGGAHLVTITDRGEDRLIVELAGERNAWLGGSDAASEGSWNWVTREPWFYENWGGAEPNNGSPNSDNPANCAIMRKEGGEVGTWYDRDCADEYTFICERIEE